MSKNTMLTVLLIFAALLFASCKKEYTCTCTGTMTVPGSPPITHEDVIAIPKSSKKEAEAHCVNSEVVWKAFVGPDGTASCNLD